MNLEDRIKSSRTNLVKMVFHNTVNDQDTMFGGIVLQWMDEVAYIAASRFARLRLVTVAVDRVLFLKPIPHGSMVEINAEVVAVNNLKIETSVELFIEDLISGERTRAVEAKFIFAAINKNRRPQRIDYVSN